MQSSRSNEEKIEKRIAKLVEAAGGRTFYVGGLVRDRLLGTENKDIDIEVHGITPDTLLGILEKIGEPLSFGKSFGVYSLRGHDIDIAMPRRERAVGRGHRDFEIDVDPFIGTAEAARRRDFTINAMMEDVITGEIIDHFGGREDLKKGIIRHIDDKTFVEDPLRVLRAAQFAARFRFTVAPETIELCRDIDLSVLSRERVEEEMKKALLKSDKPSIFFETLREMDQLEVWFPELAQTIGVEQDPIYHPEGDVWIHTMEVIDRAAQYRDRASSPYAFMLLAITHDLGKIITTEFVKGRIHAYEHETKGLPLVEDMLRRLTGDKGVIDYVLNMVPLHMRPNMAAFSKPPVKSTNKMYDAAASPEDLIYMSMADRPVMSGDEAFSGDSDFLFERLDIYREMMERPYVRGRDLIEAGLEPGEYYAEILEYAHKLRLAGIDKESAMKQTLAYARKMLGKRGKKSDKSNRY
ncbi:MAG: HD domain-containing protein [Clostridiales bacterium]|nr:HD domain-containing protein [Clostridiales bacterium]